MTAGVDRAPQRIHVLGPSGSGKTTLGIRIASILGAPIHHLDEVARAGGGNAPLRPEHERARAIADIVATPAWVTEGIHLGWTDPLLVYAQHIVWLDYVPPSLASRRILGRFLGDALTEARRRRGRERFLRFREYGQHLLSLIAHLRTVRASGDARRSIPEPGQSHAAIAVALAPYRDKVTHCVRRDDVEVFVHQLVVSLKRDLSVACASRTPGAARFDM